MQLTKVFTILSLATASLAVPTVELARRTDSVSCAQAQGTLKCCEQKPKLEPITNLGANIAPTLAGLVGIVPGILAAVVPTVAVTAQCVAIVAQVQACNAVNVCCINPSSLNTLSPSGQAGLIQLLSNNNILSNNQIAICPSVAV
ncbi:hypothetical protein DL95DRAFT_446223 [Leptodontidium sp. 2 PMI_412]|nr:hypothetical protein BKA61DRAFT_155138 [Leptodontidium sp. MPI-SDFR-AT-0119]KAH9215063.1 hypothetical protein DL95DRAFT_446223 [Leptodontidium sp. 2 PMI_412]